MNTINSINRKTQINTSRYNANRQMNQLSNTDVSKNNFSKVLNEVQGLNGIFNKASVEYGVPANLLKAIGKAESDFRVDVISKSGAQGVMQLMPATAKYLGVNDPFDPEQNIMGGSKYIAELLDKYDGDVSLALAAYNAGSNNVKKYGGIPPFKETQNYVKNVLKYMGQDMNVNLKNKTNPIKDLSKNAVMEKHLLKAAEIDNDNEYTARAVSKWHRNRNQNENNEIS